MSEMIERVGRALAAAEGHAYDPAPYNHKARAAIEAMREPTDLMGLGLPSDYKPGSHSAAQIWRTMIDAALTTKKPEHQLSPTNGGFQVRTLSQPRTGR